MLVHGGGVQVGDPAQVLRSSSPVCVPVGLVYARQHTRCVKTLKLCMSRPLLLSAQIT